MILSPIDITCKCALYTMKVHSGGLYTGYQLVTQATLMIGYLYTLFTLWQMYMHAYVNLQ